MLPRRRLLRCAFFFDDDATLVEAGEGTIAGAVFVRLGSGSPEDVVAEPGTGALGEDIAESDGRGGKFAEAKSSVVCIIIAAGHLDGSCQVPAGSYAGASRPGKATSRESAEEMGQARWTTSRMTMDSV